MARVNLLIDTDMTVDVDDVGALCIAHALADQGEANILAVVHDTGFELGAAAISVINRYYGRDGLRIGAYRGDAASIGRPSDTPGPKWVNHGKGYYVEDLVSTFPSRVRSAADAEDALFVYRTELSDAEDGSVVIVSLGRKSRARIRPSFVSQRAPNVLPSHDVSRYRSQLCTSSYTPSLAHALPARPPTVHRHDQLAAASPIGA